MKWPEDKKERMQWLVMIGIGTVVVLYVAVQFGIMPILKSKKAKLARIEELKVEIANAEKEIKQRTKDEAENKEVLQKIMDISEKYVLKPVLGLNYKITAGEVIEPVAKKQGLKIDSLRQVAIGVEASQSSLKAFTARTVLSCGYNDLVKLIREIEASNPFLSVIAVTVTSQGPESPEKHLVTFDVEWPVWADTEMPAKLSKQLKDPPKSQEAGAKK
jgi:hypothetical protein